ncbi:MAG: YbaN family protein [Pseudomonadales bacterium]|nr:YbaN family protein [Pseudomonadales bacterium]
MATTNNSHKSTVNRRLISNGVLRIFLLTVGSLSVALGVLGIFLPILPTTPFLLLSAACYVRSSERFYHWLTSHPVLSKYILAYLDGRGIPRKAKLYTFATMWLTMGLSMLVVPLWQVSILLACTGLAVSTYIWRLPEPQFEPEL